MEFNVRTQNANPTDRDSTGIYCEKLCQKLMGIQGPMAERRSRGALQTVRDFTKGSNFCHKSTGEGCSDAE